MFRIASVGVSGLMLLAPMFDDAAAPNIAIAVANFLEELFGLMREDSETVYLTDGGHIENLGLYELLRRRWANRNRQKLARISSRSTEVAEPLSRIFRLMSFRSAATNSSATF
jgi:hypothetical protein